MYNQRLISSVSIGLLVLLHSCILRSQIENPSFEKDRLTSDRVVVEKLKSWKVTQNNVEFISSAVFDASDGNFSLDLNGNQPGAIEQRVLGLKGNTNYTLKFAYADQPARKRTNDQVLATAELIINGREITTLRNTSKAPNYIEGIGFGFQSSADGSAIIQFRSTTPGEYGLVIDDLKIIEGLPQAPPKNDHLVNGSFEMKVNSTESNPHLAGDEVPGWLVMTENIDLIAIDRFGVSDGDWCIDLGGHGPGGIAQTVTDMTPGALYQLSMLYTRHIHWNQQDTLTASIYLDDELLAEVGRGQQMKAPRWEQLTYDFVAPADGE